MAANKPTQITISGHASREKYGAVSGDIYLYSNDTKDGAMARRGSHTNFGYSGYFLASIFDGKDWRKLQFNQLVEYDDRSYEIARDRNSVAQHLARIVSSWRGLTAIYSPDTRSFTLPGREIS